MAVIDFFVPGPRHYETSFYKNNHCSFANISITGSNCQCGCDHCEGQVLTQMTAAITPAALVKIGDKLAKQGCQGVLISGGADKAGTVPLAGFGAAFTELRQLGLRVVVHPGLLSETTAQVLANAAVDCVALDLIGDEQTISSVYHLNYSPADYRTSLHIARAYGLNVSPHIVVGLNYGRISGEYEAVDMVVQEGADCLVLVILKPLSGTPMGCCAPPSVQEVEVLFRKASELLPKTPIMLGCARPVGDYARIVERLAVDVGFGGMAFPSQETVEYTISKGLDTKYHEICCGIWCEK
jgi:uncharacterized radical SAM superfamily protein